MYFKSCEISATLQPGGTWFVHLSGLGTLRNEATLAEVRLIFLGK
jgi:hypothetical protein